MTPRSSHRATAGIVLVGTHPWTHSAFDRLPPRPLLPVAHRPLISYALAWLRHASVEEVAVCANRESKALASRLDRHVPAGLRVTYQEDPMPRGAAGAIRDAAMISDADTFVVTDGNSIPNVDLSALLRAHEASGAAATVVVSAEESPNGLPPMQTPSGIYVFDRRAFDDVPPRGFFDLKENLIPQLYRAGEQVNAYCAGDMSPRVLDASSYLAVNEWMVEQLVASDNQPEGYSRSNGGLFHRDAVISDSAVFVGPVLVAPGARIGAGAVIVGPTSIGCDAIVENNVLVSRSAIWRRSLLHEESVADHCILADDMIVGAGMQAFGSVMVGAAQRRLEQATESRLLVRDAHSFDVFKRMGRALFGTSLSRYPAAQ